MSINFKDSMGAEASDLIKKLFDVEAIDGKTALVRNSVFNQQQMKQVANTAKQTAEVQIHEVGDRKEVGGVVYELDEKGWRKLPIVTFVEK